MDKARVAEWALGPAVGPPQAAGVVGDLLETGAERGAVWFWSSVARTAAGAVWGDLRSQPFFYLGLALRGAVLLCAVLVSVWQARVMAFDFVRASLSHSSFLVRHPKEWLWPAVRAASLLGTAYAGRWVARRSLGRPAAVCLAMAFVYPFVYYGFGALWLAALHPGRPLPPFGAFWYHPRDAAFVAAFLLGTVLRRPRAPGR